jgi:hypothetical protein
VSWKQRISLVALIVLAALPLAGTICAIACDPAATAASGHHGADTDCQQSATPSPGTQIQGVSGHDCSNHDAAARPVAMAAGERILLQAHATPVADFAALTLSPSLAASAHGVAYTGPPATTALPTTPLVLRI